MHRTISGSDDPSRSDGRVRPQKVRAAFRRAPVRARVPIRDLDGPAVGRGETGTEQLIGDLFLRNVVVDVVTRDEGREDEPVEEFSSPSSHLNKPNGNRSSRRAT